ncbi:unnamed protein product [Knipowitschia caucasica]
MNNTSSVKTLHFTDIVYNRQHHYDPQTGVFTCIIPGIFQFNFLCISHISEKSVALWHNNKMVMQSFKLYVGQYILSGPTLLQLEAGDTVRLESSTGTIGLSSKSFFTGHMLFTT